MTQNKQAKDNPFELFRTWYEEAKTTGAEYPNAMSLATSDSSQLPAVRMVLLKDFSESGFVFFTNYMSEKAKHLDQNPQAAGCLYWEKLKKQVRLRGTVVKISDEESTAYFASRPWKSKIGAWASIQSQKLSSSLELERRVAKYVAMYTGKEVPRPEFWGGYRIVPSQIEFWQERSFRLHERRLFDRKDGVWFESSLYP